MNTNTVSIEGAWSLARFEKEVPGGHPAQPFGQRPQGMLAYTPDGFVFASLAAGDRDKIGVPMESLSVPGFKSFGPRMKYAKATARSLSYAGRYRVEGAEIWHDVSVSSFPDWVGTRLVRQFCFDGDTLILTFKDSLGVTSKLVWQRAA